MNSLELWGGHECTLNRAGNGYRDQTVLSGHEARLSDIDLFADLGIRTLRYPLLWEKHCGEAGEANWIGSNERLERMRQRGIKPIAGLVHHGAGPRHATLLSPAFAPGLAAFASDAARRHPWIDAWTPVNEPLTTARFSALYGHWHPHARDERLFWTALLNQIDAIRGSMKAIRAVNSDAKLIQTEDLGRTYSTVGTAHQAAYDNVRRWMTWDLLFGRVTSSHPLWLRLARMGFGDRLNVIADDPSPPDIVGINHYLTSDRFLDERMTLYPTGAHGGNRFMRYADVEAVRVVQPAPPSLQAAIEDVWERYQTPLALTEVHNGCTREEQLRWLDEAWSTAWLMQARGADVRAVTVWSLLGAFDWNSLLTRSEGHYEPGVFDVRSGTPRPTALAGLVSSLTRGADPPRGWTGPGWWRRDIRLTHAPVHPCQDVPLAYDASRKTGLEPPLLIVGETGTLGGMLARACTLRGIRHVVTSRRDFDLRDPVAIASALDRHCPWAVINAAGYARVDDAEKEASACKAANAFGISNLAEACAEQEIPLVAFSSDLVFDGRKGAPYVESDTVNPLNVYGVSKQMAEATMLASAGKGLIIRTAAFFSPHDHHNFAASLIRELSAGRPVDASDCVVSPTYLPDLVDAVLDLLLDGECGIWHLANQGERSWAEFGRDIARAANLPDSLVHQVRSDEMSWKAIRPSYSALTSERGLLLPALDDAIARFTARMRLTISVSHATDLRARQLFRDAI